MRRTDPSVRVQVSSIVILMITALRIQIRLCARPIQQGAIRVPLCVYVCVNERYTLCVRVIHKSARVAVASRRTSDVRRAAIQRVLEGERSDSPLRPLPHPRHFDFNFDNNNLHRHYSVEVRQSR